MNDGRYQVKMHVDYPKLSRVCATMSYLIQIPYYAKT